MTRWILTLALALMPAVAHAQLTTMPNPLITWFGLAGLVLDDGGLCVFRAGTSTLATTYTTAGGGTANANPVRFNASGRAISGGVFLTPGQSYKFVLKDFTGVSVPTCIPDSGVTIFSVDNVEAVPGSSAAVDVTATAGESIAAGDAVYLSSGTGGLNSAQLYKTDADLTYKSTSAALVGIAPSAIAAGASGSVRISGAVTVSGPLVAGQAYYADATPGAIVSTPPTNAIRLGVAENTTTLVVNYIVAPVSPRGPPCGRLTLTSGLPVTSTDVTAATTIYYTPYGGCNQISLFDGTAWSPIAFAQVSIAVPATTNQMYDVFAYDNAGVLTLELTAWTNDTTRATALVFQNGVYVKTGALTRLYVGSVRTTGVSGQTEDSFSKRFIWNYFNRVSRAVVVIEGTNSWSGGGAAFRIAGGNAANQIALVIGVAESSLEITAMSSCLNSGSGVNFETSIGIDATNAKGTNVLSANAVAPAASALLVTWASLRTVPPIGYHFYAWLEYDATGGGTTTCYGDNGGTLIQTGINGMWWS